MIVRFAVSGTLALAALIIPLVVGMELPVVTFYGSVYAAATAAVAVAATRRWPGDRILFRTRRLDEREKELLSMTDSVAVTVFLIVAGVAALVFLSLWLLAPGSVEVGIEKTPSHILALFARASRMSRSLLMFVVVHSLVGIMSFARE